MINEVIQEILVAEKQAQKITEQANAKALEIALNAQRESEKIKIDAVAEAKTQRENILSESKKTAEENYDLTVNGDKARADALIREKLGLADSLGEEIFGRILKDGSC